MQGQNITVPVEQNYTALLQKYDRLSSQLNEMRSGMVLIDKDGTVLMINKLASTHARSTQSECIGRSVNEVFRNHADTIIARVKEVFTSGKTQFYETETEFSGEKRWILSIYRPSLDEAGKFYAVQLLSIDITTEKRAHQELMEARHFLVESQRIAKMGSWEYIIESGQLYWSDELCRIFDINPQNAGYELARSMVHPDDLESWDNEFKQAVSQKRPFDLDFRIRHNDGTVLWVHSQTEVLCDANGKPWKIWGTTQDITDRKRMEDELRSKEKQYHALFKALPYSTTVWRKLENDFELIDHNDVALHYSKGRIAELIGGKASDIYSNQPEISEDLYTCFETGQPVKREMRYHRLIDDRQDYMRFHFHFCPPDLVMMEGETITRQIMAEEAAKESEAKYGRLFSLLSDPVLLIEKETGCILEVNPAAEECYGYNRDEMLKMSNRELLAQGGDTFKNIIESQQIIPLHPHKKKDGTIFPVEINANHFTWQGKDVQLALIRDISYRFEAEQQRTDLENRLRQAQKMEAIGTLAGGIAHDFNNILSSIIGFTELTIEDMEEDTLTHENLNEVLIASRRAKDLISQILTFSRHSDHQMQPTNVSHIVKESGRMLRATIPTTIELVIEDHAENSLIFGDATQIHQVILNLSTNATHAMEDLGGTLTIRIENTEFMPRDNPIATEASPGPCLKLSVGDTGIGMAPELIDRIFEPYMTTKKKGKGTGLGLAVVHGIVQSYKGHIVVKSQPDQGTTVELFLPLLEKGEKKRRAPLRRLSTGNEHILLVDDEKQIVNFQKQGLERLGFSVSGCTSSIEALETFKADPDKFQAVVTDFTMPNMTGDLLAKQIKSIRPDIPILLCTGYSEKLSRNISTTVDFDRVLIKPTDRMDIVSALREFIDREK